MLMRIGEIAGFFQVSVKALRVYEKMGILTPVKIDEKTGYRYYGADQVKQLDAVLELRGLGFSLVEIKGLLERRVTKEAYMEALTHKKAMWQDKISEAQDKIDRIEEAVNELSASDPAIKLHELNEDERAQLLSKIVCVENLHARNVVSEAIWL